MANPIKISDLRVDDVQRFALAIEGLALGHWTELPRFLTERLPNVREAAATLSAELETIAAVLAIEGVEGIEGVELGEMDDDEGEDWQGDAEDD
jgi:hypothetical protein